MSRRYPSFNDPAPGPLGFVGWFLVLLSAAFVVTMFFLLMAVFMLVTPAVAHEAASGFQYPWDCCSGIDCSEISESRVKFGTCGYFVDGHFIPQSEVRFSPDGRYHACFPKPDKLRCFFAPPMGF